MNKFEYNIVNKNDSSQLGKTLTFYQTKYEIGYSDTTLENSAIIVTAKDGDKIVGAVRAISDMSRHSMVVDLIVDEKYRRQGIGTRLMEIIVEELKNKIMETEKSNNQLRINLTYASSLEYILEQSSMLLYAEIENVKYLKKSSTSPFASR